MNTYCDDCGRCTGGVMRKSDVPGEGEDHNRCHECEGNLQSSISGLQSALAAERKRREEISDTLLATKTAADAVVEERDLLRAVWPEAVEE